MNNHFHLNKIFTEPLEFEDLYVAQIGRLYSKSTTAIEPHTHTDLFELTVVTEGRGVITTNGVAVQVQQGDIYLSQPRDIHQIETHPEQLLKYDFFAFSLKEGLFRDAFVRIARDYHAPTARVFRDERIRPLIGNAIAELNAQGPFSDELLSALFRQIVIYVVRGFQETVPPPASDNVTHAEILCYRLMNYIDTHLYSLKSLEELSAVNDYSYGYLSALFKKTTSQTLSHYYHRKRLDAARHLLQENKLTVTEIAEILNYASVYAFSKAFRKQFGVSPREYQKNGAEEGYRP